MWGVRDVSALASAAPCEASLPSLCVWGGSCVDKWVTEGRKRDRERAKSPSRGWVSASQDKCLQRRHQLYLVLSKLSWAMLMACCSVEVGCLPGCWRAGNDGGMMNLLLFFSHFISFHAVTELRGSWTAEECSTLDWRDIKTLASFNHLELSLKEPELISQQPDLLQSGIWGENQILWAYEAMTQEKTRSCFFSEEVKEEILTERVIRHWKGQPRRWWSPHPWRCSRNEWMWHSVPWSGWQWSVKGWTWWPQMSFPT